MPSKTSTSVALRRHVKVLMALLALPAMWHGQGPSYISASLLDGLIGLLHLDAIYLRIDDLDGGPAVEAWRPLTPTPPEALVASGVVSSGDHALRVTRLSSDFPHVAGVLLASSYRGDFPTRLEHAQLQVAVNQAAIALDGAHLLARERAALSHLAFLMEAGDRLASSLDAEHSLQSVANLSVPRYADACIIDIVGEDHALQVVAVAHSAAENVTCCGSSGGACRSRLRSGIRCSRCCTPASQSCWRRSR